MDQLQAKLRELLVRHCGALRSNVDLLAGLVTGIGETGDGNGEAARDALILARQISGAGGSVGFGEVSLLASGLERELQPIVAVNGVPSAGQRARILGLVASLKQIVAQATPESSDILSPGATSPGQRRMA